MSKPLAMNMYVQNAAGVFVPLSWPTYTVDNAAGSAVPEVGLGIWNGSNTNRLYGASSGAHADATGGGENASIAPWLWNGSNWDRQRANLDNISLITASGVTTTQNSADQTNFNGRGVKVYLNMTAVGTGSVTVHVQGKDPVTGTYFDILVGVAVVANGFTVYTVYPGITATANVSASDLLSRTWRAQVVANNANATTYTVSCSVEV